MSILKSLAATSVLIAAFSGCATQSSSRTAAGSTEQLAKPVELRLECPDSKRDVPNADYIGPYMGVENVIPLKEMAQDVYCSDTFKATNFPLGFVTIYGSSRIKKENKACDTNGENCNEANRVANDKLYADVRDFAKEWTKRYGNKYPIMTGAGPGLMEAGNEGAKEANGVSVGYTTYYDRAVGSDPAKPYGGDPKLALNPYVTRGLIFSSVAIREYAMIKHSAAIVLAPGGTGTEWEIFQIIETIKSRQLTKIPVYIVGNRQLHWSSFDMRLQDMMARKTINKDEVAFLKYVEDDEELVRQLSADLGLN